MNMEKNYIWIFLPLIILFLVIFNPPKIIKLPKELPKKSLAETILDKMTLEEKVGQMFIVRHPLENAKENISKYNLGGYLFFSRDFANQTPEQIKNKIKEYQEISKIPLFIAVDEEGGKVTRISSFKNFYPQPFLSSQKLYEKGGFKEIVKDTQEKCAFLKNLGFNTNFAPVVDVVTDKNSYMYERSLGLDSNKTSIYASKVVKKMNEENVISVLKHFPGYGNNLDTHAQIVTSTHSLEYLRHNDFLPFKSGITSGADLILVSHLITPQIDSLPASISKKTMALIRQELKFSGVIVTDALDMKGLKNYTKDKNPSLMAILAGADLVCTTTFANDLDEIIKSVKNGLISQKRIDKSVLRILNLKIKRKLISQ